MRTFNFAYRDQKWMAAKEPIEIPEGGDAYKVWEEAGYRLFLDYTEVLEIRKLEGDEDRPLPLFLAELILGCEGSYTVQIDTVPDLMSFLREVQPYVSIVALCEREEDV